MLYTLQQLTNHVNNESDFLTGNNDNPIHTVFQQMKVDILQYSVNFQSVNCVIIIW